jgi:hypothetical protein
MNNGNEKQSCTIFRMKSNANDFKKSIAVGPPALTGRAVIPATLKPNAMDWAELSWLFEIERYRCKKLCFL